MLIALLYMLKDDMLNGKSKKCIVTIITALSEKDAEKTSFVIKAFFGNRVVRLKDEPKMEVIMMKKRLFNKIMAVGLAVSLVNSGFSSPIADTGLLGNVSAFADEINDEEPVETAEEGVETEPSAGEEIEKPSIPEPEEENGSVSEDEAVEKTVGSDKTEEPAGDTIISVNGVTYDTSKASGSPEDLSASRDGSILCYKFTDTKKYVVYGSGAMIGPSSMSNNDYELILDNRITKIGNEAFIGYDNLVITSLPSGLTSIGNSALAGCNLSSLTSLPGGLTSIGNGALAECNLSSLTSLPGGLTSIGDNALAGCNLSSLTSLPEGLTSIGDYAFENCTNLSLTSLPEGLTSIGKWAFYGCTNLGLTSLPEGLTCIEEFAFCNCKDLSLTSLPSGLTSIGETAFYGCTNLSLTSLPEGLTSIGRSAFSGCTNLSLTSLPEGLTSIGDYAFEGCTNLSLTSLPEGLTSIGDYTFFNCTNLSLTSLPEGLTSIGEWAFDGCTNLSLTSLPEGLTSIGRQVFANCTSLSLTSLPEGLTSIGNYAFERCTNLSLTSLPEGLTSVGNYAFYFCYNIPSMTLPSTLETIGEGAFQGCDYMVTIQCSGNSITSIGSDAFRAPAQTATYLETSSDVLKNYDWVGSNRVLISKEELDTKVYVVKYDLNTGTVSGDEIIRKRRYLSGSDYYLLKLGSSDHPTAGYVPKGWAKTPNGNVIYEFDKQYRDIASPGQTITLYGVWEEPAGDTIISVNGVTYDTSKAEGDPLDVSAAEDGSILCYKFPDIQKYVIYGSGAIKDYSIGISDVAYEVIFDNRITHIGKSAFGGYKNISVKSLPEGLTSIDEAAFSECVNLSMTSLPEGLTSIGDFAFSQCTGLKLTSLPSGLTSIGKDAFQLCRNITVSSVPEGVTSIGEFAFSGCYSISSMTLPSTLEIIGEYAFQNCDDMVSIQCSGNSISSIGSNAFKASVQTATCLETASDVLNNYNWAGDNRILISREELDTKTYVVKYDLNTGTVSGGEIVREKRYLSGVDYYPLNLNSSLHPTAGYVPKGWAKTPSGSVIYEFNKRYRDIASPGQTIVLYGVWESGSDPSRDYYTISFKSNGGSGTMTDQMVSLENATPIKANTFTRDGYSFKGWSRSANGSVEYTDGQNLPAHFAGKDETVIFYAVWEKNATPPNPQTGSFTVKFDPNGGTGTMPDQVIVIGKKTALTANSFTRSGYEFSGWSDSKVGSVKYTDAAEVQDLAKDGESITLYAIWVLPSKGETYYSINVYAGAEAFKDGKAVYSAKKGQTITIKYTSTSKQKEFKEWVLTGATPKDKTAKETTFVMGSTDVLVNYSYEINEESKKETPPPADSTPVKKLVFAKKTLKLKPDDEISNPATPTYGNSAEKPEVKYVTSNSNIICVDTTGTFIATGRGSATVTAYCGNKKATCKVTVMNYTQDIAIMTANGEDITGDTYEINAGSQEMFHVAFDPCDTGDPIAVTWKSSNTKAVGVAKGLISAKDVKQDATSTITATVKYTNPSTGKTSNMSKTVTVKVKPITVPVNNAGDNSYTLSLKKSNVKLQRNISGKDSYALGITLVPKKGKSVADKLVSITSSNPSIVDVSSEEGIPVINSKGKGEVNVNLISEGNGTAYIIVKSYEAGNEDGSKVNIKRCKVTVTSPATGIEITKDTSALLEGTGDQKRIEMRLGTYDTLIAEVTPEDSTDAGKITWSASGGVTVKNGIIFAKNLTKAGKTAKVTAKCGKKETTVYVTVVK